MPFVLTAFPAVFLLGLLTVIRLVDTALESMKFLTEIARIRGYYRTLSPFAAEHFTPTQGRWPEAASPALRLGEMSASLGTTASMISVINNVVAGALVSLLVKFFAPDLPLWAGIASGITCALVLMLGFLRYERWRFVVFSSATVSNLR